jgi:hypothetical protein
LFIILLFVVYLFSLNLSSIPVSDSAAISCPARGCSVQLDELTITTMLAGKMELLDKYLRLASNAYVNVRLLYSFYCYYYIIIIIMLYIRCIRFLWIRIRRILAGVRARAARMQWRSKC